MSSTGTLLPSGYTPAAGDWVLFEGYHNPTELPGPSTPLRKCSVAQIISHNGLQLKVRRYLRARDLPAACRGALLSPDHEVVQGLQEHISPSQVVARCAVMYYSDWETGVPAPPTWKVGTPLFFSRAGLNSRREVVEPRSKYAWIQNVDRNTSQCVILPRKSTKRLHDGGMEDDTPVPFQPKRKVDPSKAAAEMLLWFARNYRFSPNGGLAAADLWGIYTKRHLPRLPPLEFAEFLKQIESKTRSEYSGNTFNNIYPRAEPLDRKLTAWCIKKYAPDDSSCISEAQMISDLEDDDSAPEVDADDVGKMVKDTFSVFCSTALLEGPRGTFEDCVIKGLRHRGPLAPLADSEGSDDEAEDAIQVDNDDENQDFTAEQAPQPVQTPRNVLRIEAAPDVAGALTSSSAARTESTAATSPAAAKSHRDRDIVKISLGAFIAHMKRVDPHRSAADWDEARQILAAALVGPDVLSMLGMTELKALGLKVGVIARMLQEVV